MISTQSIISLLILITIFIIVVALVLAISKLGLSWILGTCGYKLKKEFSSEKKRVVITGGSSGIGLELARAYLEQNAIVIIIARDVKKLTQAHEDLIESVSKSLNKNKGDVKLDYISCDVSSSDDSVRNALGPWIEKYGGVDVLVNCAGTSIAGVFEELPEQEFERMHRINVMGSVHSTRVIVPLMKKQKSGQIIFVASQVAQAAIHGYTAYAASKWALRGLAEALQMEVKPFNISVAVSYPPDTDTPGYKEEMLTKPSLTKIISESGQVFAPRSVARDIIRAADAGQFTISTGLDGWLLKLLHPGMSPVNNIFEVFEQVIFASLARFVAVFYLLSWDFLVAKHTVQQQQQTADKLKTK